MTTTTTTTNGGGDAVAPLGPVGLHFDAFDIFFHQTQSFLTARELGVFSTCSNDVRTLIRDRAVWKKVWRHASKACKKFQTEPLASAVLIHRYVGECWGKESGLLECFQNPDERILDRVGYEHAVRCLVSQHCFYCGRIAGHANPLTMTRTCHDCYKLALEGLVASKFMAKEAFCVSDDDLEGVPMASLECKHRLVLISDVMAISLVKWGGADGLEAEIASMTQREVDRFEKSQSTSTPRSRKRKRPRMEELSRRPADDPSLIGFSFMPLPIGTTHDVVDCGHDLKMTFSVKCNFCSVCGGLMTVMRHERLEHNICSLLGEAIPESHPPRDLTSIALFHSPRELIDFLEEAETQYGYICRRPPTTGYRYAAVGRESTSDEDTAECMTLRFDEVVISVDYESCAFAGCDDTGYFTVWFQLAPNAVPSEALCIGIGENMGKLSEGSARTFGTLLESLGLVQTTPSHLLAALIMKAGSLSDFFEYVLDDTNHAYKDSTDRGVLPVLHGAMKILKGVRNSSY